MTQLSELARPFKANLIKQPPKGKFGSYCAHDVYNQKLLAVLGPFDFEVVEVIRNAEGSTEGCRARLTVDIDGRTTTIVEIGDVENPTNWHTEGARLKDAASDAFKRCCMRLGCGLHLWAGQDFFLYDVLLHREEPEPVALNADLERPFL